MDLHLVLLIYFAGMCSGLRDVYVQIPLAVEKGDSATLYCGYKLEEPLYTIKWYKDGKEFYRYTPADSPPTRTFPAGCFQVDLTASSEMKVTLIHLDFDASGVYTCEVSEDMPSFQTAIVRGPMNIVELPTEMPAITGLKRTYRIGDTLKVNCTSSRGRPAANLTWYVNDRQPDESQVRTYSLPGANAVERISQIGLQFLVKHEYFTAGRLKIRCSASVYDIYWQSGEISTEEEPAATMVSVVDLQPPTTISTDQRGSNGYLDVEDVGSSVVGVRALRSLLLTLSFLVILRLAGDQ